MISDSIQPTKILCDNNLVANKKIIISKNVPKSFILNDRHDNILNKIKKHENDKSLDNESRSSFLMENVNINGDIHYKDMYNNINFDVSRLTTANDDKINHAWGMQKFIINDNKINKDTESTSLISNTQTENQDRSTIKTPNFGTQTNKFYKPTSSPTNKFLIQ